ncbi:MAG TPA: hypothetical protein VGK73_35035 [Polyangiaceae bacterium]
MSSKNPPPPPSNAARRSARCGLVERMFVALVIAVVTLLATGTARAAVPMCSGDGRTIAAPPIMAPNRGLVLEAPRPCPKQETVLVGSMPSDPGGQPAPPSSGPIRAVPVTPADLPLPCVGRAARDSASISKGLELISSIERPPRR